MSVLSLPYSLPEMDKEIEIGGYRFTRNQIVASYDPSDEVIIESGLAFGKQCYELSKRRVHAFVFTDEHLAALGIAAIMYNDCLPSDHPIKKQHTPKDVEKYLIAANYWCKN